MVLFTTNRVTESQSIIDYEIIVYLQGPYNKSLLNRPAFPSLKLFLLPLLGKRIEAIFRLKNENFQVKFRLSHNIKSFYQMFFHILFYNNLHTIHKITVSSILFCNSRQDSEAPIPLVNIQENPLNMCP